MPDVIVIGAGAAGLFCAATAARCGRSVTVLDHNDRPGKKILISGGGRCNFTNRRVGPEHFLSHNPHFCRSALARFTPDDFIALVERAGIPYHERDHGQLFCDDSAKRIVALLTDTCRAAGVVQTYGCRITGVRHDGRFHLDTSLGAYACERLVVATGGLPLPTIGASDFGLRLAQQFGLKLVPTAPALVPFTLAPADACGDLSGIAVPAQVAADGPAFRENLLFTHGGLSGPAVLQASSYWQPGTPVAIDLLPDLDVADLLSTQRRSGDQRQTATVIAQHLPKRLAQRRVPAHLAARTVASLANAEVTAIADALHRWSPVPAGTEGYRKAEVMRGGVDTAGLSSKTMSARNVPGLYFIGEVVDVTGWLGGFNFQWAWASGHAAGLAMGEPLGG